MRGRGLLTAALCAIFLLAGCGYTLLRPMESVRLGKLTNKTMEPKLDDRLTEALTHALVKRGIRIREDAPYELTGTIEKISLKTDAEKHNLAISYKVVISVTFSIRVPSGEVHALKHNSEFIIDFVSKGSMQEVIANKDEAVSKALDDLADSIAFSLVEEGSK